jgi:hypothetical protein
VVICCVNFKQLLIVLEEDLELYLFILNQVLKMLEFQTSYSDTCLQLPAILYFMDTVLGRNRMQFLLHHTFCSRNRRSYYAVRL